MEQEQVEWDDLNRLLRHRGFKPVFFADPTENKNLADLVLLDKKSAVEVRTTLRMMLTDSERWQDLIQELVQSNNQLKVEVQEHMSRAAQQSQRATELEELLDKVKTRVQDLEDRYLGKAVQQLGSRTQQLQQENQEAQRQCKILEHKLSKQKEEAAQLQRKLYFITKGEERRLALQHQTFQNICRKMSRQSSPADQQVLDVIDFYETKMTLLLDELSLQKEDSTAEISATISDQAKEARLRACYHHLLNEIHAIITNHKAPLRLHRKKHSTTGLELSDFQDLPSTLRVWAQQLDLLKGLQCSLNKLSVRLMPWQPWDGDCNTDEVVKVENMMLLVDTMLENVSADDEEVLRSPTRYTLGSMVSHFQKLFDVTSLSGVYPRMNEVYTRLGEMTNAMRNLRDVLDLDSRVSPAEVVNQVARLVSTRHTAGFPDLLGDADIDSIVMKVKQHDKFFPAFHALFTEILHTLGVSHLDDVLPALKSLTETAQ
ncbi:centrosomal protein of 70 kDa isoform X2 [Archocentrus centrarchus]|uniref:centrosomal protein of 70 kDa isoform X2 n=1 Tax=Archocentrus centrarchus TaxID=63155 RepID=UPI0011E9F532|nr:centrosomal protein of 70 kDa isoform X2 [Archocentrus centrarchus]